MPGKFPEFRAKNFDATRSNGSFFLRKKRKKFVAFAKINFMKTSSYKFDVSLFIGKGDNKQC